MKKHLIQPYELQVGEFYHLDPPGKQRNTYVPVYNKQGVVVNKDIKSPKVIPPMLYLGLETKNNLWVDSARNLYTALKKQRMPARVFEIEFLVFLKDQVYYVDKKFIKFFTRSFH